MNVSKFLIVEDNRALSMALAAAVSQTGASCEIAATAAQAGDLLKKAAGSFTAMILDIGLPDQNGLEFLESIPVSCRLPTIIITAHGEVENTIESRKLGALEFFTKPIDFESFKLALKGLSEEEISTSELPPRSSPYIGAAPSMRQVFQQIAHACASDSPVLITGSTGTGKSLSAELVYRNSIQAHQQKIFFRPAVENQVNELDQALEASAGGVLMIDDLTDLDHPAQAELVRQWEQKAETFPRILAISSVDLRQAVESGKLRSDLYYRLQVLEIKLPALSERMEDLPALFSFFLAQLQPGRSITCEEEALQILKNYAWPGNLRELRNVASYTLTACGSGSTITPHHLPEHLLTLVEGENHTDSSLQIELDQWLDDWGELPSYREIADQLERLLIERLLCRFDGKLARMSNALNANRTTLRKKLRSGVS